MKRSLCLRIFLKGLLIIISTTVGGCAVMTNSNSNTEYENFESNNSASVMATKSQSENVANLTDAEDKKAKAEAEKVIKALNGCYDNVNSGSSSPMSLSSLLWTKKQYDTSGIKNKAVFLFSAQNNHGLKITFIIDGNAVRQELLNYGVDFSVNNNVLHVSDAFGAAINNGPRTVQLQLYRDGNTLAAKVNNITTYKYASNAAACVISSKPEPKQIKDSEQIKGSVKENKKKSTVAPVTKSKMK